MTITNPVNGSTYELCDDCGDEVATVETQSGAWVCAECSGKYRSLSSEDYSND